MSITRRITKATGKEFCQAIISTQQEAQLLLRDRATFVSVDKKCFRLRPI